MTPEPKNGHVGEEARVQTKHNLIITADDYGMCESVNRAIEACLGAGTVRATCVMSNMPTAPEAQHLRRRFPHASLGIHWTLTEGKSLLPAARIPSLVRADGSFYPAAELRRRWLRRQIVVAELKEELAAQYRQLCHLTGPPMFWNTHQNVHVLPGLFETCVAVARDLRLPAMRCHRRFTLPYGQSPAGYALRHPLYWSKGLALAWWARYARARGMRMPDGLLHAPGYATEPAAVAEVLRRVPWHTVTHAVELVIHPATRTEPMFHLNAARRVLEYTVFRAPSLLRLLSQTGVELVGFESFASL